MGFFDSLLGKETGAEKQLRALSTAGFNSKTLQKFLPDSLRNASTKGFLQSGISGIGNLIRNPGELSPTVGSAIRPRLAAESENISQNFRGIRGQQAGQAARSNLPTSIKGALSSALDVAQERAQRGARRGALQQSEQLRRGDLQQTFGVLEAILGFLASGKGQSIGGLGQAASIAQQRGAALQSFVGGLASTAATGGMSNLVPKGGGGGGGGPVS